MNHSHSALTPANTTPTSPALCWDVFCRVIDNHGDLGVCWRLCADLAQRGHTLRLWVDDASALVWMAPVGCAGVTVHAWPTEASLQTLANDVSFQIGDVVIEAFGCEVPEAFQARMARSQPVWINLEYLSAEGYVARSHGLASPVMSGPARGMTKWFFFPGFTPETGGLLREPDVLEAPKFPTQATRATTAGSSTARSPTAPSSRQFNFNRTAWLHTLTLDQPVAPHERLVSLFCYEPAALPDLLQQLSEDATPTRLLVAQGRPWAAVTAALQRLETPQTHPKPARSDSQANGHRFGALHISPLPYLSQTEFDHLLWACDFNFVRGEDSLVRALWAGQPLAWHIYPQDDLAHHDKLHAFEAALDMPADLREFHAVWNGLQTTPLPAFSRAALGRWRDWSQQVQQRLRTQTDLVTQLIRFVAQKR